MDPLSVLRLLAQETRSPTSRTSLVSPVLPLNLPLSRLPLLSESLISQFERGILSQTDIGFMYSAALNAFHSACSQLLQFTFISNQ